MQVEGMLELNESVEILIRLLCAVPGWSETNALVQQQMIDVITCITSIALKFPKKCVVLCLLGISECVADIKTCNHAMKCLTTFSEAVGPWFIFKRLFKITKERDNSQVLTRILDWMASAVEDFGVSHLKLKDLIDFCKETGLQSSVPATSTASLKLIGVLHKFIGPDIDRFLSDVEPAVLDNIKEECCKNPFQGAFAVPKKCSEESAWSSTFGGGLDNPPREDISGKVCLESIDTVNKVLEANKRNPLVGTELLGALRASLNDKDKSVAVAALFTIGAVASTMEPSLGSSSMGIVLDILECLGDNEKQMREAAISVLDMLLASAHLDKMVFPIAAALGDAELGAKGRKYLFDWLSKQLNGLTHFSDAVILYKAASSATTDDESDDVRKAAAACLTEVFRLCGIEEESHFGFVSLTISF